MIESISLITGNESKAREYSGLLGFEVAAVKEDLVEIQSLDVVEVVKHKALDAYSKLRGPVMVDDTGLALDAWNGLPGALVTWFLGSVGVQGILEMAAQVTDRACTVTTALGYADEKGARVFTGSLRGTVATEPRGDNGFGYDPIFVPEGGVLTYAEMTSEQKLGVSQRRAAVASLRDWLSAG
ncbi:non-canonical purine NTP pyrophosphatase [Saccharopolyspora taberi]|uniref:XTP/dITP diphosphatase n=1 Tax=Saccharopolyspora taberi TaxID=60895 RepID=A0ABN3V6U9_9PSEU